MSEINEECKKKLIEFLSNYKSPTIRVITTLKDGYVKFIPPIPTISGAEIHCNSKSLQEVKRVMF